MSNQQGGKPPGGPPDPAGPQSTTAPGGHGGPQQPRQLPQPFPNQPQPPQQNQAMWPPPQSPYARPAAPPPPQPPPQQPAPYAPPPYAQPPQPYQQPAYPPPPAAPPPSAPPPMAPPPSAPPPGFAPGQPPPGYAMAPPASPPPAYAPPPPQPAWVGGAPDQTVGFQQAVGRAMRLRIEPHEVTAAERAALNAAGVTDPYLQAFLAWRRSVLTLVAVLLIPLTIVRIISATDLGKVPLLEKLVFIELVPALLEGVLCAMCWYQLRNWTKWRTQRRTLLITWIVFMAGPFLVYLVPLDPLIEEGLRNQLGIGQDDRALGMGDKAAIKQAVSGVKTIISVYALATLAPKAVSLLAGVIRAGVVTKMLFPGSAGPGWLIVLAAPMYTLFVFTLLIVPFQVTGSGWFVGAMIAITVAQASLMRAGYALARPVTRQEAIGGIQKARTVYLIAMISFGACVIIALGTLAEGLGVKKIITTVLSFEANVLLLTLIGSDLVITNLDRGRGVSEGTTKLSDETNQKLATFVGVKSPFANKPPG